LHGNLPPGRKMFRVRHGFTGQLNYRTLLLEAANQKVLFPGLMLKKE